MAARQRRDPRIAPRAGRGLARQFQNPNPMGVIPGRAVTLLRRKYFLSRTASCWSERTLECRRRGRAVFALSPCGRGLNGVATIAMGQGTSSQKKLPAKRSPPLFLDVAPTRGPPPPGERAKTSDAVKVRREPGIHKPRLWLWIPGPALARRPGMTT